MFSIVHNLRFLNFTMHMINKAMQQKVLQYSNYNIRNIVTPVLPDVLQNLLIEVGYDEQKTSYLVQGFRNGFKLNYVGPWKVQKSAPNLKLCIGSLTEMWNKFMTEVKAKRYAGPFKKIPFKYFIQSPIGLVPKDKGTKTRLIFHLSYPKNRQSVNSGIPDECYSVEYPEFSKAIQLCLKARKNCKIAKSDMSMAFRHVSLRRSSWKYLVLKAIH